MNRISAPLQTVAHVDLRSEANTLLQGSWLIVARIGWVACGGLTLTVFFASIPVYSAQFQTICSSATCAYRQLSPEQVIALRAHRTLVYGSLSTLLALLYFGCVFGLQALFHALTGQGAASPLIMVFSTLAIAALFQPLRQCIQQAIDRRFYRQQYDAAKTLATFSATLRRELDLTELGEQLVTVVHETMQPSSISLWLRQPEHQTHEHLTHKESV